MVSDLSSLASILAEATPERRLETRVKAQRTQIETALKTVGKYEFEDDEGRVFVIRADNNGQGQ
jgi:hypothetical protein